MAAVRFLSPVGVKKRVIPSTRPFNWFAAERLCKCSLSENVEEDADELGLASMFLLLFLAMMLLLAFCIALTLLCCKNKTKLSSTTSAYHYVAWYSMQHLNALHNISGY